LIVIVSDLHLDPARPAVATAFHALLRRESATAEALYVLGDLFEAWIGDDDDDPFNEATATALAQATRRTTVHLLHGNRDFLLGQRFAERTGCVLGIDCLLVDHRGTRLLLCHGDALCTDDTAYQALRATFRSPAWQAGMLARPLAERRAVASALRAQSREASANKPERIMDVAPAAVEALMRGHDVRTLVHGHTHRPGIHAFRLDGAPARRIVLGDWGRCGWLLRVDGDAHRLECFPVGS
jgi:UDP-2,3-diacylglucosamine hydrolase